MRKFVLQTVIVYLVLVLAIVFITFYFYGRIASGYVDEKVSDIVLVDATSSEKQLAAVMEYNYNQVRDCYDSTTDKTLTNLNESVKELNSNLDLGIEFGYIDLSDGLQLVDKEYSYNMYFLKENFIPKDVYFLNYKEAFNEEEDIKLVYNFGIDQLTGEYTIALLDAGSVFNSILQELNQYQADSFIITSDGYTHFYTENIGNTNFYESLKETSENYKLEDFKNDVKEKAQGVVSSFRFNDQHAHIAYTPIDVYGAKDSYLFVSIYYDTNINTFSESLTTPLLLMFVLVAICVFVGATLLFIVVLKKNDDIESSKLSLYYSRPYILKIGKNGKIVYKNKSFQELDIDWEKYPNIYNADVVGEDIDIMGSIRKKKSIRVQFITRSGYTHTFYFISVNTRFTTYLVGEDDTSNYKYLKRLEKDNKYDAVTQLPNRRMLMEDLEMHLQYIKKEYHKENYVNSSLVLFSLQSIERYINIFGQNIFDKLIINFTEIVKDTLKEGMKIYRLERDLFGVLFESVDQYTDVIDWGLNLNDILKKPINIDDNKLVLSTQAGVFNIELQEHPDLDVNLIYEYAEISLNHSKALTSINYMVYNISLGRTVVRDNIMEADLKVAVENDEFAVFVQPQYNTTTNRIVGFEALVRWVNPKYASDSPLKFIEMAEKNNMIVKIGKIVFEKAFAMAKQLEPFKIELAINISPAQLIQDGFVSEVIDLGNKFEINPELIALEVTETFLVENMKQVVDKLAILKKVGYKIHLDDFGTGYSSMLYLKDLPIDALKIDREFVRHINTEKSVRAIVSKFASLAQNLDLEVIAEGVEDERQSQWLNKNGCEIIQGYLIGKPMTFDKGLELVDKYNVKKTMILGVDKEERKKEKSGGRN